MKSLALTLILASVSTVAMSATGTQDTPAAGVEPSIEPVCPASAHRGLIDCLRTISDASDPASIHFYSMRSKVVPATEDEGELVAVEIKVGLHAASGSLAEAAFKDAQAALIELKKVTKARRFEYMDSAEGFIHARPFPKADHPPGPEGGTHIGTLRVELPAAAISQPRELPGAEVAKGGEAAADPDPSAVALYVRKVAMGAKVALPLKISERKRDADSPPTYGISPSWKQGRLRDVDTVDRARIANLMYLLETESRRIDITSVEIAGPADGEAEGCFRTFELEVRRR